MRKVMSRLSTSVGVESPLASGLAKTSPITALFSS